MSLVESSSGGGSSGGRSGAEGARGGRSALISDLVAQLKRGDITKTELFSRLQQLQGPGSAAASLSTGSATDGARSVSVAASASTSAAPVANHRAENSVAQKGQPSRRVSPPTTASSAVSSARAAGAAAAESAGFFSALDRQAIIQKIADERRRRVEEVRQSLPTTKGQANARRSSSSAHPALQSSSSVDLSASIAQVDSVELDYSAASQASLQNHQEHNPSAPLMPGDTSGARGVALEDGCRAALGPTSWEEGQEEHQQQSASEISPSSTLDTSTDEFPFPGIRDQQQHGDGSKGRDDRGDVLDVEANGVNDTHTLTFGSPPSSARCPGTRPSSSAVVGDTASENSKLSRGGSTRISRTSKNHGNRAILADSMHTRNEGGSTSSGPGEVSSLPGWSLHANRPSGSSGGTMSGRGTFGASIGLGGSGSGSAREPSTAQADSWTNGDGGKTSPQDRYRSGRVAAVSPRQGVHSATGRSRHPERGAAGQGGWMGESDPSEVNGGSREEARQQQHQQAQQGEDWPGGLRVGPGGNERQQQQQASEKMVDEDAYRFRSFSEERARRGEELVRRELMSECTFRPKIKGLPQSYGATNHDDTPFLQRVNQWQRDKEKYADARKADGQDKELEECTFTPRVNSVSRRAARSRRQALGENHLAVDDRLYDESVRRDMERSHLAAEQAAREEERLYQECTFMPDFPTKRAAEAAAAAAAAAGDGEDQNNLDWGHSVPRGRSRYRQAAAAVAAAVATGGGGASTVWGAGRRANGPKGGSGGRGSRHWELESCTFTPTIIGARKGMNQAQQYLQYDVVDRLTGAAFRPPDENDYNDVGSEEGEELFQEGGGILRTSQRQGFGFGFSGVGGRTGGAGGGGISSQAWRSSGDYREKGGLDQSTGRGIQQQEEQSPRRQGTGGAASDTSSSFHAFLSRQNKMETDKRKHIEEIQAMRQNTFRPEICAESKKIHLESNKGDFLQRVARDAARKEHEALRQKAAGLHDPDCTFKPQITARSATLQARSVVELSRGDQLKRETTQRLTRLRAEQELLADTTFRPRINADAASRMAVSKLKIVSDPDSYIANVETIRRRKEQTVVRGAIEKAAKEVEGCTFQPITTECPAYIKRIAQSISASKALPGSEGGRGKRQQARIKPDWK